MQEAGCDSFANGDTDEQSEHPVVVSSYLLDRYEVTVGRFRAFVGSQADGGSFAPPNAGDGEHPGIPGSGWDRDWDPQLPTTRAAWDSRLTSTSTSCTWEPTPDANEAKAISCVTWYEAMAFCVWDGGYLPTEAEWEYAAAGGDENRRFPWGPAEPADDCSRANWTGCGLFLGFPGVRPVGASPTGTGRWGHRDLAGNVSEWVLDFYDSGFYDETAASGEDVCNLSPFSWRVHRGGGYGSVPNYIRAASRAGEAPTVRANNAGFRCARAP